MDDLISRQELLKRTIYNPLHVLYISSQDVLDCPSAQQWIPCSERLPDSQEDVLCDDDGSVTIGYYTDEEIGWHDTHSYRIYPTAWMPLPKPYREEETPT